MSGGPRPQAEYISQNMMMTTAAYHGGMDPEPGVLPMADANVSLAEFRHWAALVRPEAGLAADDARLLCVGEPSPPSA